MPPDPTATPQESFAVTDPAVPTVVAPGLPAGVRVETRLTPPDSARRMGSEEFRAAAHRLNNTFAGRTLVESMARAYLAAQAAVLRDVLQVPAGVIADALHYTAATLAPPAPAPGG